MGKVLVTGSPGFIGIHQVDYLDEILFQLANIDLQPTRSEDVVRESVLWYIWYSRLKGNRSNQRFKFAKK
jgi:hypothetical protein